MSSANRVLVEISPYSVQLAIVSGRRLVARGDWLLDAKEALAEFLTAHHAVGATIVLVSPKQPFAQVVREGSGAARTEADLLAAMSVLPPGLIPPLSVVACDAVTGKAFDPVMKGSILLAAAATDSLVVARDQLGALGVGAPACTGLALPAQLGAVVAALQDMSESTRVAVLTLGENDSVLALVSAGGVEVVQSVAVGYIQIFEAVKAELGLKFRAAATRLFFNAGYDFADTADKISARLAAPIQAALEGFPNLPTALQVAGLPEKQAWLGRSLGQAINLNNWAPDMTKICAQLELQVSPGGEPAPSALSLVQLAAADDASLAAWLPGFLGHRPKSAPVSAMAKPAAIVTPVPVPAQVPAAPRASVLPARPIVPPPQPNKALPKPPKAIAAAPAVKPVPAPAPPPAPVQAREIKTAPKAVTPVERQDPVADLPALPSARSKHFFALYGIILAVVLVAVGVGVKVHLDGEKQAKAQQAADEARKLDAEKIEASLKINPVTGLPGLWIHADIGATLSPGSAVFAKGKFVLTGFGRDIGTFKDGFLFTYVSFSGDGAITARMVALSGEDRVAKIGLMVRGSLEENSEHVSLLIQNKGKNMKMVWREKTGAKTSINDSSGNAVITQPVWLRLVRAGNIITAYQSADGKAWGVVAGTPLTVEMPASAYFGLAVCARGPKPVVVTFDHVSLPDWDSSPAIPEGGR